MQPQQLTGSKITSNFTMDPMHQESQTQIIWNSKQTTGEEHKVEEKCDDWSCASFETDDDVCSQQSISEEELHDILRSLDEETHDGIDPVGLEIQMHACNGTNFVNERKVHCLTSVETACGGELNLTDEELKLITEASSVLRQHLKYNKCERNRKLF
eukprot:12827494-Ditylum_brightwellii.AAC.1